MRFLVVCFVVFVFVFLISGCVEKGDECSSDEDCSKAGCSGELCVPKKDAGNVFSVCVYKPEYECYRNAVCGCVDGYCRWKDSEALEECLQRFK